MIKRLFDIVVSFFLIVTFLPLFFLIMILLIINDGLPVFFLQERVGKSMINFNIFKFRTMKVDSFNNNYKTELNDQRITRIGTFLRKYSLDELPQLFNVLLGDMSLVGPRPNVPMQNSLYSIDELSIRSSVRPGITGLAQIRGRSNLNHLERTSIELEYIENLSFKLDCYILYKTFYHVLFEGGY